MTKARDNADNWAADITGVTAGIGITGGGTSGAVTVTNSLLTTVDAAGDLLYGTGSDAATRLAIGTAGQVLQVRRRGKTITFIIYDIMKCYNKIGEING
jgi:hypothetical protein